VVHDPISNHFFRLSPAAYHFVGLLDGARTVDEVWRLTLDRFGDSSPTQNEVIGLLSQLNESNLLRIDLPPDAEPLLRRRRDRNLRQWAGQASSVLFLRLPVFNPDRLLSWLLPFFRPFLSGWALAAWVGWIGFVAWQFLPHLSEFIADAQSVLSPTNWFWMMLVFTLIKVWHELGHGLVCKRFGGVVPEVGVMMMVLLPVPYVDATSSWGFAGRAQRMLVGAAGMLFELAIAGVCALLWLHAEPGSTLRQLTYNATFMASVATVLFNANPLLRFDGYYILSDWLEIPNLYDRSGKHLQWLVQRYAFGMTNAPEVATAFREKAVFTLYGVGSFIYRVVIMVGITMFVAGKFFTVGLILAVWSLAAWLVFPAVKFLRWLVTGPALSEHRGRAVAVTVVFAAVLIGATGFVPVVDRRRAVGVVEGSQRIDLAIQTDGLVTRVLIEAGDRVTAGQVILEADNPELRAARQEGEAVLKGLELEHREAVATDLVKAMVTTAKIETVTEELMDLQKRLDDLVLRSPQDGVVIGRMLKPLLGQFMKRGQVIAQVVAPGALRVTALVDQSQSALMFDEGNQIERVELRMASRPGLDVESHVIEAFPSGRSELPHPALGFEGGGDIAVRSDESGEQKTLRPQFELWLDLPGVTGDRMGDYYPGQRVSVRLTLEQRRPLLSQWVHQLRQVIRERLSI
jgi:putative peptide zinc metalloprotease protein